MLELSIHAGIPGNKIQAHSAANGTTWITGSDEHGLSATLYIEEAEASQIVECLAKAYPSTTLRLQLEWLESFKRAVPEMVSKITFDNTIPTSTITENQHV